MRGPFPQRKNLLVRPNGLVCRANKRVYSNGMIRNWPCSGLLMKRRRKSARDRIRYRTVFYNRVHFTIRCHALSRTCSQERVDDPSFRQPRPSFYQSERRIKLFVNFLRVSVHLQGNLRLFFECCRPIKILFGFLLGDQPRRRLLNESVRFQAC